METTETTFQQENAQIAPYSLLREPLKRELYYTALAEVRRSGSEGMGRFELEACMAECSQSMTMFQSMGTLVDTLVKTGAIDEVRPEAVFDPDTQEAYIDASKIRYYANETGDVILDTLAPVKRIDELLSSEPGYVGDFKNLLEFCSAAKRSRAEIDEFLDGVCKSAPNPDRKTRQGIYPSYFVDRLAGAGALAWENGWTITEAGKSCLEICR